MPLKQARRCWTRLAHFQVIAERQTCQCAEMIREYEGCSLPMLKEILEDIRIKSSAGRHLQCWAPDLGIEASQYVESLRLNWKLLFLLLTFRLFLFKVCEVMHEVHRCTSGPVLVLDIDFRSRSKELRSKTSKETGRIIRKQSNGLSLKLV